MPGVVLSTLNAKYIHSAFGLRYLLANMGELRARTRILEFDLKQRPVDIVEALLAADPEIVGFGVYIWNVSQTTEVVATLKRLRPEIIVVLGGPEVSFETHGQPVVELADYVVAGEADLTFPGLCERLLAGERPAARIIASPTPDPAKVRLPYDLYDDDDIGHRVIYVEASRGCPFSCEFCLSSLEIPVRQFPIDGFLTAMERLLERGVTQFKFVDRTFNLNLKISRRILEFFLERMRPGLFVHFEMIPDRLPDGLREIIARFPSGALQFEVGIQTFNSDVAALISRRQDYDRLEGNIRFLRGKTGVHIHADLIVGLPGESLESFGSGFDRLIALGPQEIQVGVLKRLRGTPIIRHDEEWGMVYNPAPPYEILQNRLLSFPELQRMRTFARYWDLVGNSGNFSGTTALLWRDLPSPFDAFLKFSDWLFARTRARHGIALTRLMELLHTYLTKEANVASDEAAGALWDDCLSAGRKDIPPFLRELLPDREPPPRSSIQAAGPRRQSRHTAAGRL